ncbi:Uncharacterised protein [Serratia fonticola]|uniref:Uncharacterized protein n=1 Tax=Serratia fonticola TaxID=47917 RepID=A0A4U9UI38_SERFO|nr:Uncharacterised protein [Serratia fonticola]
MVAISGISNAYFRVQACILSLVTVLPSAILDEREPVVIIDPELRDTLFETDETPEGKSSSLAVRLTG